MQSILNKASDKDGPTIQTDKLDHKQQQTPKLPPMGNTNATNQASSGAAGTPNDSAPESTEFKSADSHILQVSREGYDYDYGCDCDYFPSPLPSLTTSNRLYYIVLLKF